MTPELRERLRDHKRSVRLIAQLAEVRTDVDRSWLQQRLHRTTVNVEDRLDLDAPAVGELLIDDLRRQQDAICRFLRDELRRTITK